VIVNVNSLLTFISVLAIVSSIVKLHIDRETIDYFESKVRVRHSHAMRIQPELIGIYLLF
jgi:hypothetical protein